MATDLGEYRALSNMAPICALDTVLKAGGGFKMGHKGYFRREGFRLARRWDYVARERSSQSLLMKVNTYTAISG